MKDYFKIDAVSNSDLKHFKRSPAHYRWYKDNGQERKEHFDFGNVVHLLVFEPEKIKDRVIIYDENARPEPDKTFASIKNKAWKKAFFEGNDDKAIITLHDFQLAKKVVDGIHRNRYASDLIMDAQNEFEKVFEWEFNGVKCKAKLDISNPAFNADIKTCQDAGPRQFIRDAWNYDYYRQAAIYNYGSSKNFLKDFFFIAVEKEPPFACAVYKCTPELLEYGFNEYEELIDRFWACKAKNIWPGYEVLSISESFDLDIPNYAKA